MDRNGLPLALVKNSPDQETHAGTPTVISSKCPICGGFITERRSGTTYCCDGAELAGLRALADELDRRLAIELEEPPMDDHAVRFLTYARGRVRCARRLKVEA